jgi:glucans biosynthesis protein
MKRRKFLEQTGSILAAASIPSSLLVLAERARALDLRTLGESQSFDYAWLKGLARSLSRKPHESHTDHVPPSVANLGWDAYQAIQFRKDHALWAGENTLFRAQFFHLGLYFKTPVRIFEVSGGDARELAYDPALFDYGKSGLRGDRLPRALGFAGFRLNFHSDWTRDIAAFLGASYFRAVGGEFQYGLSARGLAVNCGMSEPEEFPSFTSFWLERPKEGDTSTTVYALLESPSVTGAYRFTISPGDNLLMDVDAALYPRRAIERIGIGTCTSMYQCGENDRRMAYDFRPEIHDSDGLSMWTGKGEWIWRPLNNPRALRFNAYLDENPRGFGLMQRDRNFENYQDDGVYYDRRPSLWVEPKSGWGKGSVQLVEIPTIDETFDNIVAFWNPAEKPEPGKELLFSYRLHWGGRPSIQPSLARVVATRVGLGGVVGQKRSYYSQRFAIDFAGENLAALDAKAKVEAVIRASRGTVEITSARKLDAIRGYRAMFDLKPPDASTDPIDIRLYLRSKKSALSETWLYQWTPPPPAERQIF